MAYRPGWPLPFVGLIAGFAPSAPLEERDRVFESQIVRLRFAPASQGYCVRGIADAGTGTQFVARGASGPVWRLELRNGEGKIVEVDSLANGEGGSTLDRGRSLTLRWRGVGVPNEPGVLDVRATIRLDEADPRLSHWRLEVDNRSKAWGIWKVHFPLIQGLAKAEGAYFAWPEKVGGLTTTPLQRLPIQMIYPMHLATMQFAALGAADGCLYLATHDPRAFWKEYALESDGNGGAQYRFTHFPEGMGEAGRAFRQPYEVTIGVLEGDWIDACKLYRKWALKQEWCGPPLAERQSTPQWFKDIAGWFVNYWDEVTGQTADPDEATAGAANYVEKPVAFQWYSWHRIPSTHGGFGDYFPVTRSFHRVRDMLHDAGVRIVPYINARLWGTVRESFRDENAEPWATVNENGEKHIEDWGSLNHVMCPATRFWQEKIASICERIVGEFGCDGVYVDQAGSYLPIPCFAPQHGHALGGGDWWVSGYREMVRACQERARAANLEAILTTEDNAEPFSDLFDGLLTWSGTFVAPDLVPMFHFVYSGCLITYGRNEGYEPLARDQQNAQMFVWGTQLGWMDGAHFQPDTDNAKFLRTLAGAYSNAARRFTLYGEMLRPARVLGGVATGKANWTETLSVTMPEVVHSLWRAPDGTLGLVVANWSHETDILQFEVDLERAADVTAATVTDLCASAPLKEVEGATVQLQVQMLPRSARVFEITGH